MTKLLMLLSLALSAMSLTSTAHAGSLTVKIFDDRQEPLPDTVVYLVPDKPVDTNGSGEFEIEQRQKMFSPFVTILPAGARAMFPNRDGIGHHVYSFSPAKSFQLPLSEQESTDTITFDQPGIVTIGCNIHDWMVAYIYIVNTPYYNKSDASGVAFFDNLPDGNYEIHVTHPGMKSATSLTRQITLGTDSTQDFTLDLKPEYFWRPAAQTGEEIY